MRHSTLAIAFTIAAIALTASSTQEAPAAVQGDGCDRVYGGRTWSPLIDRAYALRKWRQADPRSAAQKRRIKNHRRCPRTAKTGAWMVRSAQRHRGRFKAHRKAELAARRSDCIPGVTVYEGGGGCWSIPSEIVACESGYSWSAYNPSGARGPYQLLGWGAPMPADTIAKKKEHHRIAARLWAGGAGRGHWVC